MQQDELKPPKILRKPNRVPRESWERFVEGLFPKLSTATHRLVPITAEPGSLRFDVVPVLPDDRTLTTQSVAQHIAQPVAQPVAQRNARMTVHRVVLRGDRRGDSHCTCSAFRYGVYGTCSHILFARSQLEQSGASPDDAARPYSEIFLRHGLRREIVFRPAPDTPRIVLKAARHCFDADGRFLFDRYAMLKTLIDRAAACRHELRIDDDVFARLAFATQQRERHRKIMAAFPRGAPSGALDTLLTAPLAAYQREAALNAATAGRFLLFDAPGLGRRRTAVAAAEILAQTAGVRRVLVLTNTPTLHTWLAELRQSTSRSSQAVFGSPAKRSQCYAADVHYTIARYDDLKDDLAAITGRMKPDLILLDETHTLRRHGDETARVVRRLESEHLFILSGTAPLRMPGAFVSFVDMIDRHRTGLLDDVLARHQRFDMRDNSIRYVNMNNVANTLPKHFRRLESTEFRRSLPEWIEHDRYLPLTEAQAKRHADLQSRLFHLASGFGLQASDIRLQASGGDTETSRDTDASSEVRTSKPEVLTLHEIQAVLAEMLNAAGDMALIDPAQPSGCKINAMYELLQEHLESPRGKAVVFAHDPRLLKSARTKLAKSPVECDLIDRFMTSHEQKDVGMRFRHEPNCRVLFVSDGVDDRLAFKNVRLVIHLDIPWNADCVRQRTAHVVPHPTMQPCHAYQLISYGTIEHWLARLRGGDPLFVASDLRDGQSVVLLDEPDRVKFFERVTAMLKQVKEPPMVVPSQHSEHEG